MEDDPIEDGAAVAMNAATSVARVAETLLRAAQQHKLAQEEMRARLTEDARRQYEAEATMAEEFFKRATEPEWMDQATPRETSEAWLGAQRWQQVDGDRFAGYAETLNEHYQERYGLDLADIAQRLESPELAAELAEARVGRTRDAAREDQEKAGAEKSPAAGKQSEKTPGPQVETGRKLSEIEQAQALATAHAPAWYTRHHMVDEEGQMFVRDGLGLMGDMKHFEERGTIPQQSLMEEWARHNGKSFDGEEATRAGALREFWDESAKEREELEKSDRAGRGGDAAASRERESAQTVKNLRFSTGTEYRDGSPYYPSITKDQALERLNREGPTGVGDEDLRCWVGMDPDVDVALRQKHAHLFENGEVRDESAEQAQTEAGRARREAFNFDHAEGDHRDEAERAGVRKDGARTEYDSSARRSVEADRLVTAGVSPKVVQARQVASHLNGADPKGAAASGVRAGKGKAPTRSRGGQQQQRVQGRGR